MHYGTDSRQREFKRVEDGCAESACDFLQAHHLVGLRALGAFDDVEFNPVAFFQALVSFAQDGAVVDKYVRPAIAAKEAVALCIVKPLHDAFVLCQWSELPFRSDYEQSGGRAQ